MNETTLTQTHNETEDTTYDQGRSLWQDAIARLLKNKMAILGLVELLGISRSLLANPAFIGRYLEVYLWLAAVYWLACTAMALLARHLEIQLDPVRSNR